jgi:hypothetical protein
MVLSPLVGPHSAATDRRAPSAGRRRDRRRRTAHPRLAPINDLAGPPQGEGDGVSKDFTSRHLSIRT